MKNTTLCYIERDGQYLMLHRTMKENDLNHDKWIGIGGKFEDKESPEECVIRETMEETGLTAYAKVKPAVDFSVLESVTVLLDFEGKGENPS